MAKKVPKQKFRKGKEVKTAQQGSTAKETKSRALQSFEIFNPSWQLSKIEMAAPYGWHQLDNQKLIELKQKLQSFESMTWNEILIDGKKHHHSVEVYKLKKMARDRLIEIKLDDIESLVSLKVGSRGRIWGIKKQSVLLLLWWDSEHAVCPSLLKHT